MNVGQLINELNKFPKDFEVLTKKTKVFGNCGEIFEVKLDTYSSFGTVNKCVMLSDKCEEEKE